MLNLFRMSGPVAASIQGVIAAFGGLTIYNLSQRPTTQTIEGVDNTTLLAFAAVGGLFIWLNSGK
jgi:hypothetical protein